MKGKGFIALLISLFIFRIFFPHKLEASNRSKKIEKVEEIHKQVAEIINKRKYPKEVTGIAGLAFLGACLGASSLALSPVLDISPVVFKRKPLKEVKAILIAAFGRYIRFDEAVYEKLLSKKTDKIVITKFLQTLEALREEKVIFKQNPIIIDSSTKVLEIQILKDWRVYVKREGEFYTVCNIGHKNTQLKDIKRLKARHGNIAG